MSTHLKSESEDSLNTPFILPNDREGVYNTPRKRHTWSQQALYQIPCLATFQRISVTLLACWGFLSLFLFPTHWLVFRGPPELDVYRPETLPHGLDACYCGVTIEEARSLDCIYDALSTAWLPPYCRDDELTEEFSQAGPGANGSWEYFADANGTILLSLHEVGLLGEIGGTFWVSRDWHIAHCLFYWQKYFRMRTTNVVMEKRFDSLHHILHCTKLARNPKPDYLVLIEVPVQMNSTEFL
ncbi:hypothetical protein F5Y14DRAFT_465633 [Nemania sp. NC0429]|nr:hypothetical protein F5Y14DRAFT_465633 [Nemania sp. NC0429]